MLIYGPPLDFKAKHVVWRAKDGKILMSEESENNHANGEIIKTFDNWDDAALFVEAYRKLYPEQFDAVIE